MDAENMKIQQEMEIKRTPKSAEDMTDLNNRQNEAFKFFGESLKELMMKVEKDYQFRIMLGLSYTRDAIIPQFNAMNVKEYEAVSAPAVEPGVEADGGRGVVNTDSPAESKEDGESKTA